MTDPQGGGNDTFTITGITNGAINTGSNSYVSLNNTSAGFAGSSVTLSNSNRTVTVTVGATCTGTACSTLSTNTTAASFTYVASTTIADPSANVTTGTRPTTLRLF
jgi:hypothetical protein